MEMKEVSPVVKEKVNIIGRINKIQFKAIHFLLPAMIVYTVFSLYPLIDVIKLSFLNWNGLSEVKEYVGIENYAKVLTQDPVFWVAFENTIIWTILSITIPPFLGFVIALSLNQNIFGKTVLRAIFYLPVIIAPIAVATMWRWMYDPFFGLFNSIFNSFELEFLIQDWLGDKDVALYSIFIGYIWQTMGFSMVLFLAGLQGVSQTLVEAARIDGANRFQIFKYVTLPAIQPTIAIVVVLSLINSLKAFDIVYGMTGGGPAQSTQMLALWAYTQAMQIYDFGKGSAISVILLVITLMIVIPYLIWNTKKEGKSHA